MKTRIYIDGYNLYFGCLKGTPYKWLDPVSLSSQLIARSGVPESIMAELAVKFFTAEISQKAASNSSSLKDQRAYHLALHNYCHSRIEVIQGSYVINKARFPRVEEDHNGKEKEPRDSERVKIWKMEEKQIDVNVALEAVYDAFTDPDLEHIVFMTNDTDIVPALLKIRQLNELKIRNTIKVGLITPLHKRETHIRVNKSLSNLADWTIRYISENELKRAQLPCRVVGKRKTALKPLSWFKYSEEVTDILNILSAPDVEGSIHKAWKWLEKPLHIAKGLPYVEVRPVDLMDHKDALSVIRAHVVAYAKHSTFR